MYFVRALLSVPKISSNFVPNMGKTALIASRKVSKTYMNMDQILIIILLVAAAFVLLSIGVIFRKDHTFRSQHITENPRMKQNKIHCATSQDREMRREKKHSIRVQDL